MVVTLFFFIVGSVIGMTHAQWWEALPAIKPLSLVSTFGAWPALALILAVFGLLALVTILTERGEPGISKQLAAVALGLAAVNIATMALAGRPWGVTSAFALWGSKVLAPFGVDLASRSPQLRAGVLADVTSVMDIGIILGALFAAALAGRFAPTWRVPARSLAAAVLGGLLLGYGARIALQLQYRGLLQWDCFRQLAWMAVARRRLRRECGALLRPVFGLSS